jgi:hypothetical protein
VITFRAVLPSGGTDCTIWDLQPSRLTLVAAGIDPGSASPVVEETDVE